MAGLYFFNQPNHHMKRDPYPIAVGMLLGSIESYLLLTKLCPINEHHALMRDHLEKTILEIRSNLAAAEEDNP
jgi:hypothetical protein